MTIECADSACKRIFLIVIGSLAVIPTLIIFFPLTDYYLGLINGYYYGSKYVCDNPCTGQFEKCKYINNLPDGVQTYSAIQMFLVSLALLADLCLVIITGIHHCGAGGGCGGAAPTPGQFCPAPPC